VRGNNRSKVFQTNKDKYLYLDLIKKYKEKYEFKLYSYCILDNHAHLLIEVAKIPLSKIMQSIQQVYTQKFNKTYERTGHAFEQRYKGILCDKESYLLSLIRYIHTNPIKAYVAEGLDYRWSSHREYINQKSEIVDLEFPLSLFSKDKAKQRGLYIEFLSKEQDDDIEDYALSKEEIMFLGYGGRGSHGSYNDDHDNCGGHGSYSDHVGHSGHSGENRIDQREKKIQLKLDTIIDNTLDYFGLSQQLLRSNKRSRQISLARRAVIVLSKEYTDEPNIAISRALDVTESLVSKVDKALLESDTVLNEVCREIRDRMKQGRGCDAARTGWDKNVNVNAMRQEQGTTGT
ncbi:MAG: transposase, partial [Mahellales bacterium]